MKSPTKAGLGNAVLLGRTWVTGIGMGEPARSAVLRDSLLLWDGGVNKLDALVDIALEALCGGFEEGLLLVGDVAENVVRLFGAGGLNSCQSSMSKLNRWELEEHTPSSTGAEKYSTPTCLAISMPPSTPGR